MKKFEIRIKFEAPTEVLDHISLRNFIEATRELLDSHFPGWQVYSEPPVTVSWETDEPAQPTPTGPEGAMERLYSPSEVWEICERIISETKGLTVPDGSFGNFGTRLPNRLHDQEVAMIDTAYRKLFRILAGSDE